MSKMSRVVFSITTILGLVVGGGTILARPDYVWDFEDFYSYAVDSKADPGNVFLSGYTKGTGPDLRKVTTSSKFYKNGTYITSETESDTGRDAWTKTSYYTRPGTTEAEVKTVHKVYTLDGSYLSETSAASWKKKK
ncbi:MULTISPECIES: hypothetical protein [Brevibacillus]|uniref:Uncharacterized protein n=1 Tax=Brevibacillus brevis TaxID=1393 RepID=A0A2Z4MN00_BREBE|nr:MULTISPECIES: hypothetical protein [Brevibacillus]AWX57907.1 hypothetical protein AB432_023995 [Brevibacillus brevis]NRR21254.1 hypothetical protein [Brevibacillus sp. MS2.2]RAT97402.1 hypothetical protein ASG16_012485 [Brevibacillus sp. Leaf182]